jgi:hypothetical protein
MAWKDSRGVLARRLDIHMHACCSPCAWHVFKIIWFYCFGLIVIVTLSFTVPVDSFIVATHAATVVGCNTVKLLRTIHFTA